MTDWCRFACNILWGKENPKPSVTLESSDWSINNWIHSDRHNLSSLEYLKNDQSIFLINFLMFLSVIQKDKNESTLTGTFQWPMALWMWQLEVQIILFWGKKKTQKDILH